MNTKFKLIIFFVVILCILFVLRLLAGTNRNEVSADEITIINQRDLKITFTDNLSAASVAEKIIYRLKVSNNSNQDFGSLRIYGYLGLPDNKSKISQSLFPDWLTPKSMQKYPDENYFNYLVPLPAHSEASVNLPLRVKKFQPLQDTLYSEAFIQLINPKKSWNFFQINPISSGPIISSVEDITKVN